jgi:hypothetical protein
MFPRIAGAGCSLVTGKFGGQSNIGFEARNSIHNPTTTLRLLDQRQSDKVCGGIRGLLNRLLQQNPSTADIRRSNVMEQKAILLQQLISFV